jgi:hypothetical protein
MLRGRPEGMQGSESASLFLEDQNQKIFPLEASRRVLERLLLCSPSRPMNIKRILVPIDYSPCSRVALRLAAELGQRFGAALDVVHVWDRPSYVSDVVLTRTDAISPKSLIVLIEENAHRDLAEFLASAEVPAGTALSSRLVAGDPASALLHELKLLALLWDPHCWSRSVSRWTAACCLA